MKFLSMILLLLVFFSLLCSCGEQKADHFFSSSLTEEEEDLSFFMSRRDKDADRSRTLEQSHQVYKGSPLCNSSTDCIKDCDHIFSIDKDREDCRALTSVQVDRFKKLYNGIIEKKLKLLSQIDAFDLKVFFNLGPEVLFRFFKTLDPVSTKVFLSWIASDWRVAKVFYNEDWDFLFFEIFFKQVGYSPISSLKEEISKDRTFAELAWLKQSDSALFWLDAYFKEVQCINFEANKKEDCVLVQYCLLNESFKNDVSVEIMDFENLKLILDKKNSHSYVSLKNFCSDFCSSEGKLNPCDDFNQR